MGAGLLTSINSKKIAELSLAHRLPTCHGFREAVVAGGLISLGLIAVNRVWRSCWKLDTKTRSIGSARRDRKEAAVRFDD